MLYHYLASDKNGKVSEGDLDADSLNGVLQHLVGQDLRPISVKPIQEKRRVRFLGSGIKIADKVFLAKYLALMLRVGTDLLAAIDILILDFENPAMKNLLLEVRDNLVRGRPFYEVFGRYPNTFSLVFVNLIKSAEASGNLQQTFEDLSVSLAEEAELRSQIRSALIYPIILIVFAVSIFTFISTFALPKIAAVFEDSNVEPPFFSQLVFGVGLFVNDHVILFLGSLIGITAFLIVFFKYTLAGKRVADRLFSNLPFIRKIYRDLAVQRFASTLSSLMKAGLPIVQAIDITADTVGYQALRISLLRISREGLAKGLTIGEAFRRETAFPRVVTNLVAISEKAGHLEEVLNTLANFYAVNLKSLIKSLVSFLEPVLLVVMGVMVGMIALSVIVPIYQLATTF